MKAIHLIVHPFCKPFLYTVNESWFQLPHYGTYTNNKVHWFTYFIFMNLFPPVLHLKLQIHTSNYTQALLSFLKVWSFSIKSVNSKIRRTHLSPQQNIQGSFYNYNITPSRYTRTSNLFDNSFLLSKLNCSTNLAKLHLVHISNGGIRVIFNKQSISTFYKTQTNKGQIPRSLK